MTVYGWRSLESSVLASFIPQVKVKRCLGEEGVGR